MFSLLLTLKGESSVLNLLQSAFVYPLCLGNHSYMVVSEAWRCKCYKEYTNWHGVYEQGFVWVSFLE